MSTTERARSKSWGASPHKAHGRKRFTLKKQPPQVGMMGGLAYDSEGGLRLLIKKEGRRVPAPKLEGSGSRCLACPLALAGLLYGRLPRSLSSIAAQHRSSA